MSQDIMHFGIHMIIQLPKTMRSGDIRRLRPTYAGRLSHSRAIYLLEVYFA